MIGQIHLLHGRPDATICINTSFITSITAFVKNYIDRTVEEVRFEKKLEQQFTKYGMMKIKISRSSSMSSKLEPCIPAPPQLSASSDKNEEKEKNAETATAEVSK